MRYIGALCVVVVLLMAGSGSPARGSDAALTSSQFLRAFEAWHRGGNHDVSQPDSPFHRYLDWPMHDGLVGDDIDIFFRLQEIGYCWHLTGFAERGFLARHPHLERAFRDYELAMSFAYDLVVAQSNAGQRCIAKRHLRKVALKAFSETGIWEPVALPGRQNASVKTEKESVRRRRAAYRTLYRLAFCEDYIPAIRDMERYQEVAEIVLDMPDQIHLAQRVQAHGMDGVLTQRLFTLMIADRPQVPPLAPVRDPRITEMCKTWSGD